MTTEVSELSDCRMYGATVFLLRLSRAFCAAPVSLEKRRSSYCVSVSRRHAILGCTIYLSLQLMIVGVVALDAFYEVQNPRRPGYMSSLGSRSAFVIRFAACFLGSVTLMASVYGGTRRIRRLMLYFTRIEKINIDIGNTRISRSREKRLYFMLGISVTFVVIMYVVKAVLSTQEVLHFRRNLIIHVGYTLFYLEQVVSCCMLLQITTVTIRLLWSLQSLNKNIDLMRAQITTEGSNSTMIDKIRRYLDAYTSIVDVARLVDAGEGETMLLLICNYTFSISVCLYFTLAYHSADNTAWRTARVVAQLVHCAQVVFNVVLLVEPCQRTHEQAYLICLRLLQLRRTQTLVGQALCGPSSALDEASEVLARFYQVTEGSGIVYMPLGLLKVSRSFYAALIGGLTTYMVIAFQISDK